LGTLPNEPIAVMILARAPIPGQAKTRLIPALGAAEAAKLQARFITATVQKACAAATGAVTLWTTPTSSHPLFDACARNYPVILRSQPVGDLGERMLAALDAARGPALVVGTDCPGLTSEHLRDCAAQLREGDDAVFLPSEDGGYVLVGTRRPDRKTFQGIPWGTSRVMERTRERLRELQWRWSEPCTLWDIDTPADLARLVAFSAESKDTP